MSAGMSDKSARPRVLVAEDSATERRIYTTVLEDAGFEVHEAPDGRYALDICRIIHPDVLVLDLGLPQLSGIEVLRRLRDDHKIFATPVVVLTADDRDSTSELAFYEGATDFAAKPVDPTDLVARVGEALRRGGEVVPH